MVEISAENEATMQDLLAVYDDETNAQARYLAFAEKADAEQMHGVASLCRAAARAEHFHAANHARAIRQLGVEAWCTNREVEVKSTLQNMKDALEGERNEIASVYPGVLLEAKKQRNRGVIRAFAWALEAEKTHVRLYADAVAQIESGKKDSWIGMTRRFFVCPTCGCTSETVEADESCLVCRRPQERFEAVE